MPARDRDHSLNQGRLSPKGCFRHNQIILQTGYGELKFRYASLAVALDKIHIEKPKLRFDTQRIGRFSRKSFTRLGISLDQCDRDAIFGELSGQ